MCEQNSDSTKTSNSLPLEYPENQELKNYPERVSLFENCDSKSNESQIQDSNDSFKTLGPQGDIKPDIEQSNKNFDLPSSSVHENSALNLSKSLQQRSCAICLEDYPDYNLSLHPNCDCILCSHCIEVSEMEFFDCSFSFVKLNNFCACNS